MAAMSILPALQSSLGGNNSSMAATLAANVTKLQMENRELVHQLSTLGERYKSDNLVFFLFSFTHIVINTRCRPIKRWTLFMLPKMTYFLYMRKGWTST